jgi:hypothetical protein
LKALDAVGVQPYHLSMNLSRVLICIAAISATQCVFAEKVNKCKDSSGHIFMTDRLCGDPATEQSSRQPSQIVVDQIEAEDVFRSRGESRDDRPPASPEFMNSRDIPRGPDPSSPTATDARH